MADSFNNKNNTNRKKSESRSSTERKTSGATTVKRSSTQRKITVSREISDSDIKKSSTGKSSVSKSGEGKSSAGKSSVSKSGAGKSSTGKSSVSKSGAGKSSAGKTSVNKTGAGKSSVSKSSAGRSSTGKTITGKNNAGKSVADSDKNKRLHISDSKKQQKKAKKVIIAFELIGILIFAALGTAYFMSKSKDNAAVDVYTEQEVQNAGIIIDGVNVSLMTQEQAKQILMNKHPWSMTVTYDGQRYEIDNYIEKEINSILYDALATRADAEYTISISNPESIAASVAKTVSDMWSQPAVDAAITGYDTETGEFILSEGQSGRIIDVEKLTEDISRELASGNYTAEISAAGETSSPVFSKEDYKILGTYKTTTTSNENRNTNIRIACETICGTILQPQEQFSYNEILGRRTADKGYKEAGAYANGEHVLELGGGICQVSSTIYNATIFAGIQIDKRTGHTYEPSYVTPGEDAAVSYSTPDFVFSNNSGATLGIKTTFKDRTIVATVFGVPILPEGVTQYMRSEKTSDVEPPADILVEDPMVPPGQSQVVSGPKNGSKWATYIIQEKDGEIIKEEYYHTTTYRGTAAEIHVNTTGVDPAVYAAQQAAAAAAAAAQQQQEAAAAAAAAQQQQQEQQQQQQQEIPEQ